MKSDAEILKAFRLDAGITGVQMASEIGITPSYLSTLESGRKPIARWVMEKARTVALEKSHSNLKDEPCAPPSPLKAQCAEHFGAFLDLCENDAAKLGWTLVELRRHFPLNLWDKK